MTVNFYTLGCKVNQYETQVLRELFQKNGYTLAQERSAADVTVINSCSVTAESDRKTRQLLRRCRKENPNAIIVLTGCMVQAFPQESSALKEADIVVGNKDVTRIPQLTESFIQNNRKRIVEIAAHQKNDAFNTPCIGDFSERTRAYLKIEDGCERYCTYCIIPSARGFVRSKSPQEILSETQKLAANGFCEIVLVGINLTSYGKNEPFDLSDAVHTVCSVPGIRRVRLGSLEPDCITTEMLHRFSEEEKFCPQFHLSLQSGCDATLKRMNRRYDTSFYEDLVNRIRAVFPDGSVTTDIMVGFAQETEEEFQESLAFAKKIGFAKTHVFMYSRRNGTIAAALKNQVFQQEKERRSQLMIAATTVSEQEFLAKQCGKIFPVLFETGIDGYAVGYTPNYSKVFVPSAESFVGQIKEVKLLTVENDHCIGTIIS